MKKKLLYLSLIAMLALSACSSAMDKNAAPSTANSDYGYAEEMAYAEAPMAADPSMPEVEGSQERMVIQTANLRVSVADTVLAMNETSALAKRMGGYVVSTDRYTTSNNSGTYTRTNIIIRVPAEKLEEAMEAVRQMSATGKDGILNESLSGEDVTSDFVDSSARLRNLKAAEEQLVKLMENTEDLEATMLVFKQLTETRSQIEVLEGHIKYLKESAALSSLSVEFVAEASLQPIQIGGWKPEGVVKESVQRLIQTSQDLVDFLIRFGITCLPFLIPLGVGIYFLVRAIRKSSAKRRAEKAKLPEEIVPIEWDDKEEKKD
jgi:hypothetical protein